MNSFEICIETPQFIWKNVFMEEIFFVSQKLLNFFVLPAAVVSESLCYLRQYLSLPKLSCTNVSRNDDINGFFRNYDVNSSFGPLMGKKDPEWYMWFPEKQNGRWMGFCPTMSDYFCNYGVQNINIIFSAIL